MSSSAEEYEPAVPRADVSEPARTPVLRYAVAIAIGGAVPIALFDLAWILRTTGFEQNGLSLGIAAFALAYPWMVRSILRAPLSTGFANLLAGFSVVLAFFSILSGIQNGLTDEPFTIASYRDLLLAGHNPYAVPISVSYLQYGSVYSFAGYYVYLPLLLFLVPPGLDYKWLCLAAWLAVVYAVRRDPLSTVLLAQPYLALIAANGYNDLVVLLFLTWGFVGIGGRRQRWAELLSLGLKQFANLFVLGYYLARKDARGVLVTASVTLAFLLPFLLWTPTPTLCNGLLYGVPPACGRYSNHLMVGWNWNYSVYPVWFLAVFYREVGARLRSVHGWALRYWRPDSGA